MAYRTNTYHNLSKRPLLLALMAIGVFLLALPFSAKALTISPPRLELSGDPGSTLNAEMKVMNDSSESVTFYTQVENFEAKDESGNPAFSQVKEGLALWTEVPATVNANPGETVVIPIKISIPQSTNPGGYFGTVFARTTPPSGGGGEVTLGTRVGTLILLKVNGEIPMESKLLEYGVRDKQRLHTSLPIQFYYRFQNTGGDRVKPQGHIKVKNLGLWTAKTLSANRPDGSVLPQSIRRFETYWINGGGGEEDIRTVAEKRSPGSFFEEAKYQFSHFAFGVYNAKLDIEVGGGERVKDSFWFIVFPWQFLSIAVPGILILLLVLKFALNRYRASIIKKYQK